jgi:hypothetical protein
MDESKLKTIVKYKAKGNKTFKNYDAIVVEAIKGRHITVEIEGMIGQFSLAWDSFMYVADFFGNTVTCDFKVTRDFTAKKVSENSNQPTVVVKRKQSGKPISQQ